MYPLLLPLRDAFIQLRIQLTVPAPVPHQAFAKRGDPPSFPVLRPDPADLDTVLTHHVQLLLADFGAPLNAQDDAVIHPVRQFWLAAK
ncbi:hypothetical protein D3C75_1092980 [compost metagenome]